MPWKVPIIEVKPETSWQLLHIVMAQIATYFHIWNPTAFQWIFILQSGHKKLGLVQDTATQGQVEQSLYRESHGHGPWPAYVLRPPQTLPSSTLRYPQHRARLKLPTWPMGTTSHHGIQGTAIMENSNNNNNNNLQPTTYNLQSTIYNLKPTTYNLQPTTNNQQPTTKNHNLKQLGHLGSLG